MANAVVTVLEADGTTETDVTVLDVGRQAAAVSKSLATCTEDKAVLDAMAASLAIIDNVGRAAAASSGSIATCTEDKAVLDAIATSLDNIDTATTPLGQTTKSASLPITIASDQEIAHDAADSGTPTKVGFKAIAGMSGLTLVAAADRTNAFAGLDGALYVRPNCGLEDISVGKATNTDGTSTEVIATAGSGVKLYLKQVILVNMHASSVIYVEMKSGTTSMMYLPCPPGGATFNFDPPWPPNAANEAWNFDPSAATTTIYCSAQAFKSKI